MSPSRSVNGGYKPTSASEEEGVEVHGLDELEQHEEYELRDLRKESQSPTQPGAEEYDSDSQLGDDFAPENGEHYLLPSNQTPSVSYTAEEEAKVKRKLDRNLVLFVALLYMLSFLDRGNLGNAKLAGLTTDLNIIHFSNLLTAFYTPYILFQPLSHLYTVLPAHIHLTIIVLLWGIISSLQSLCTSVLPLLLLRFFLGISEAAFAGIPIYLSFFFNREELAFRLGIFIAAAPLASSFAGTLAAGILALGDTLPIASWRLLFLLEGFPAVLISVIVWLWIPDTPSSATWLTLRERKIAKKRLPVSPPSTNAGKSGKIAWKAIFAPLLDPKSYLLSSLFFAVNLSFSSIPVFLPTILAAMGFSPLHSQALTAPPYLLAVLAILLTAHLSDKYRTRSTPLIFHSISAALGFLILATAEKSGIGEWGRYLAVFPITSGLFSCVAGIITWQVNNEGTKEGKGTGFAALQMVGQCGSLVGSGVLFHEEERPFWGWGMGVCCLGMMWVGVGSVGLRWWLRRQNVKKGMEYLL